MRIIFVRHGHPNYEKDCLTDLGVLHAKAVAQRLKNENEPIEKIFSSTCGRALETASFIDSKFGVGVVGLDFMREIKWGSVDGAIRDEGFSYHYVEASRYIYTKKEVTDKIASFLDERKVPYLRGLVWTTDALFRETADRVEQRKVEGAKIVEMEQSGCIAVAQFRGFDYGAIIYGGDDVASEEWSDRGWNTRHGIRYNLIMLCKEIVNVI